MTFTECQKGGKEMKRIIATIIILVLCFAMAGCPAIEDGPIKEDYTGNKEDMRKLFAILLRQKKLVTIVERRKYST